MIDDAGLQRRISVHKNFGATHGQALERARQWMPIQQAGQSAMCADCGTIYRASPDAHRFHLRRAHRVTIEVEHVAIP